MNRFLAFVCLLAGILAQPAPVAAAEPLTVNWYHDATALQPVIDAYMAETGRQVVVTSDYDTFSTDVILVSDYKNLTEAKKFGKFQLLESKAATSIVPARWRDRDGYWVGIMLRARAPIYNRALVEAADRPTSWFDLASPKWQGKITLRSAANVYNRTLLAWMIHSYGEARAKAWATAVRANAGADPDYQGDTANAALVATGAFPMTIANSYYLGYMKFAGWEKKPEMVDQLGVSWLDQDGRGHHVNVTGAAIAAETEKVDEARALIEWLLTPRGQALLSQHVYKYPVRSDVPPSPYLQGFGAIRMDETDLNDLEPYYDRADQMFREVGWQAFW